MELRDATLFDSISLPANAPLIVSELNCMPFSFELRDFILQCLRRDPAHRATCVALLQHPFLRRYTQIAPTPVTELSFVSVERAAVGGG